MWILEEHIEQNLVLFENEQMIEGLLEEFTKDHPSVAAFLLSDDGEILEEEEKNYFAFLLSFYWLLIKKYSTVVLTNKTEIAELAENNWDIVLNRGSLNFRESLNKVFDIYAETEALAFLEDSLEMEENDFLTSTGRDYIFVMIKSMLDYFLDIK